MSSSTDSDVTTLLEQANQGSKRALDALYQVVNNELRELARRHMEREFGKGLPGVTLQPTALVNESFLRLIRQRNKFDSRGHFFAIATRVLIRILRDYQRERSAKKRGGGWVRVCVDPDESPAESSAPSLEQGISIEQLEVAMHKLETLDARKADVVKLRVLWGLSIQEASDALGVSHATIERDWEFARAWLNTELLEHES